MQRLALMLDGIGASSCSAASFSALGPYPWTAAEIDSPNSWRWAPASSRFLDAVIQQLKNQRLLPVCWSCYLAFRCVGRFLLAIDCVDLMRWGFVVAFDNSLQLCYFGDFGSTFAGRGYFTPKPEDFGDSGWNLRSKAETVEFMEVFEIWNGSLCALGYFYHQ